MRKILLRSFHFSTFTGKNVVREFNHAFSREINNALSRIYYLYSNLYSISAWSAKGQIVISELPCFLWSSKKHGHCSISMLCRGTNIGFKPIIEYCRFDMVNKVMTGKILQIQKRQQQGFQAKQKKRKQNKTNKQTKNKNKTNKRKKSMSVIALA